MDEILAMATSATREALNGKRFLKKIEDECGIRPRVISGKTEARLILSAMLRIAVGLDRGQTQTVKHLRVRKRKKKLEILLESSGDCALEVKASGERKVLLEKELGYAIEIPTTRDLEFSTPVEHEGG